MKKIFAYLAVAAALTFAASCSREATGPEFQGKDSISISLAYEGLDTKATPGTGLENKVTSVEYYFYAEGSTTPVYHKYVENPTLSTDLKYTISLVVGEGELANKTYNDFFPNGADCQFFAVFNYPAEIGAETLETVKQKAVSNTFAHNIPDAKGDPHWFVTTDEDTELDINPRYEKYFVMTGSTALSPNPAGISGTVEMKRIAAKIQFVIKVAQSKEVTTPDGATQVWTPMLNDNNPRVYLSNAVGNSLIGSADPTDAQAGTGPIFPEALNQFDYEPEILDFKGGYTSTSSIYYTFPLAWEDGEDSEIFCKLIIPWKMEQKENGVVTYTTQRELYYKVLFPEKEIIANNYFVYTIKADFLGYEGEEPTITLTADKAQVFDWVTSGDINPVISAAKYLSVERGVETPDVIYTTGTVITYAASDPVTMVVKNIYQKNLSTGNNEYLIQDGEIQDDTLSDRNDKNASPRKESEVEWTEDYVNGWIKLVDENHLFELYHQLNSDLTSLNMDATPYTYEIELHLGEPGSDTYNSDTYTKLVTIVQYPEVFVVEDPNRSSSDDYGYAFLNTYTGSSTVTTRYGSGYNATDYYTYLSGGPLYYQRPYLYRANYIGGIHGLTGDNQNPNMYVLTISVSDNYVIGDPRSTSVSNPSFTYTAGGGNREYSYDYGYYYERGRTFNGTWNSAPWTEGGNHPLTYYYPASGSNTSNMIAPKIRIASSYGVCTTGISEDNAIARCAAYQEDGIPAGRWRLPTLAEVQFIGTLSSLGRIPYLFGNIAIDEETGELVDDNSYYWTANGLILINNLKKQAEPVDSGDGTESVRCVYDEWYWGDAVTNDGIPKRPVTASTFTWGDKQR
ncbi:MAG: hypothetical protein IJL91_01770 [Bacteroidales bacterium]|nr:hypothetical protein [Bacteroidales bacterium]